MSYIDKTEAKLYLGVNWDETLDPFVDLAISQVVDYIEKYCGEEKFGRRVFKAPDPDNDEERNFDGTGKHWLSVGDLREITKLEIENEIKEKNVDFFLYPSNAREVGEPFAWIELAKPETRGALNPRMQVIQSSPYIFDIGQNNVKVTGKWGYSENVPNAIKLATLKLVGGVLKENLTDEDVRELKSETFDDYKVTYQDVSKVSHALKVDDILNQYKRKVRSNEGGIRQL